jgi:predicted metal-dependent hydrolase
MISQIKLGDMIVDVELKNIKNIHLSVYPPTGRVHISAPEKMDLDRIRVYALSKLDWISQQQKKFYDQERESPREYLERESHYLWGDRFLLQFKEENKVPSIELSRKQMIFHLRPGTGQQKKQAIIEDWYRRQVREVSAPMIVKWEKTLGVKTKRIFIQRMKTRWGSCTSLKGYIRLNTELAKKQRECLEYIIVHELCHLIEPTHNARFVALLDKHLPHWKQLRDALNRAPLGHVEWEY